MVQSNCKYVLCIGQGYKEQKTSTNSIYNVQHLASCTGYSFYTKG